MRLAGAPSSGESRRGNDSGALSYFNLSELEREYNRLFVGPGHVVCPPYESVYATDRLGNEAGLVLGLQAHSVQSSYNESGLVIARGFTDLPDHVAVELEFMKYLCGRESEAQGKDRSEWRGRQARFIREHLGVWGPTFADSVAKHATYPPYRRAAELLKVFLEEEQTSLSDQAGERTS